MTNFTEIALQVHTDLDEDSSQEQLRPLSPSLTSSQGSNKPKKKPTVTPRTLKRFFTPRSLIRSSNSTGSSRKIFEDITVSGSNRLLFTQTKGNKTLSQSTGELENCSRKRKRQSVNLIPSSLSQPSPLIYKKNPLTNMSQNDQPGSFILTSKDHSLASDREDQACIPAWKPDAIKPTLFARPPGCAPLRSTFRRELGMSSIHGYECTFHDYRSEVACFYASNNDAFKFDQTAGKSQGQSPFTAASCNENSLIAIGDEEGYITLLESAQNGKPEFSKEFLVFQVHKNAIIDLCFSADDLRLATASGDGKAKIVDMLHQKAIRVLGHHGSVKQVRFQPGNPDIVATATRNGQVKIWDLRCGGSDNHVEDIDATSVPLTSYHTAVSAETYQPIQIRPIHIIERAHGLIGLTNSWSTNPTSGSMMGATSSANAPDGSGLISVTGLAFLNTGRENLFVTGSSYDATVKLWDVRNMRSHRRHRGTPLSTTMAPLNHYGAKARRFGLSSLALSGDGKRLYTLCMDSTIYTYATSHLMNGQAPELSPTHSEPRKSAVSNQSAPGPIYGFAHKELRTNTFFPKLAVRPATDNRGEILAVGSSDEVPVLFPTDERYHHYSPMGSRHALKNPPEIPAQTSETSSNAPKYIPTYRNGVPLRGHTREVTTVTWTPAGDLVSIGDDSRAICWRQGEKGEAKALRALRTRIDDNWRHGWADVDQEWDDDDE